MSGSALFTPPPSAGLSVLIFCSVVDNFGDIGICWRLSRQLVAEQQCQVRLFVDDLSSFAKICPAIDVQAAEQTVAGVIILAWRPDCAPQSQLSPAVLAQVNLCIEALACTIAPDFLNALAAANPAALWLNLEYLTAEDWAVGCHGLPSPQAGIALKKYFFFPGFTAEVGGLLREQNVVARAQQLQQNPAAAKAGWEQLGLAAPAAGTQVISVFAYSQQGLAQWLDLLSQAEQPTWLLVADGALAQGLRQQYPALQHADIMQQGALKLQILPFVAQQDYDTLLALSDLNFVRGEDSVIRAHWAGRPFVWQIYRQAEQAHLDKLDAFLSLMLADAPPALAACWRQVHLAWEQEQNFAAIWPQLLDNFDEIQGLTLRWQHKLMAQQDLASNLVRFAQNRLIMSRNFS